MTAFLVAAMHCAGFAESRMVTAVVGAPVSAVPFVSAGRSLHWNQGTLQLSLSRAIRGENGGVIAGETVGSVHATLAAAARAWMGSPYAKLNITVEPTDEQYVSAAGNLVTFTDPAPFDNGLCDRSRAAACTLVTFVVDTGEIQNATIAFNPYLRFSSTGPPNTLDVGAVMLHEVGHALGLDHSGLLNAAMSPFVETLTSLGTPSFVLRQISPDDLYSAAEIYPAADAASRLGRVSGTAEVDGRPLAGGHVMAVREDGTPVRSTVTDTGGRYAMALEPGAYALVLEPLDGPVQLADFTRSAGKEPLQFPTVFWSAAGGDSLRPDLVEVAGGGSVTADFTVSGGEVSNVQGIGVVGEDETNYVFQVDLPRGGEYLLSAIIDPSPIGGRPSLRVSGTAVQPIGETKRGSDPDLAEQMVSVPADASLGSYNVYYHDGTSGAVLAGTVRVTVRPSVTTVKETEDGQGITISGTDLAGFEAQSEGTTQLGGISVRIGDRYAPILAVSPTEIRAGLPAGIGFGAVQVTVVAGDNARSAPVSLDLVAK